MFELFDHTADVGIRVAANSVESLFVEAAKGLSSLLVRNLNDVRPLETVEVTLHGESLEYLLFDWLNELLFRFECESFVFREFQVQIENGDLQASLQGERLPAPSDLLDHEVKAITYHGLFVRNEGERWQAEVIVDI